MFKKLKSFLENDSYFYVLLILLVGAISFGLGRLSVGEFSGDQASTPQMVQIASLEPQNSPQNTDSRPVVASKQGTKYHLLDCPGALQMKEENRIEFDSIDAATAAGYLPAGNCPGI